MKRLVCIITLTVLILILFTINRDHAMLPLKTSELAGVKYGGWSGVIRVWVCEGWAKDTAVWFNKCASSFERANEGVYVQYYYVDNSAIQGICENGIIPPDVIIFPPGVLNSSAHLIPLSQEYEVNTFLTGAGSYCGVEYACPIAMGGYAWAYNTNTLGGIPSSWEDTSAVLSVPIDTPQHRWSAALLALCSGRYALEKASDPSDILSYEMDLGLFDTEDIPEPAASSVPSEEYIGYCQLPDNLTFSESAFSDFVDSRITAVPVNQYQVQRLKNLSDQGKCPDWEIGLSGEIAYTDQILYAAVVDRQSVPEKQKLCQSLIIHFLSDSCQNTLGSAGIFSVTDVSAGYKNYDPIKSIEDVLQKRPLYATPAFGEPSHKSLDFIVREFLNKKGFSEQIYRDLYSLLI